MPYVFGFLAAGAVFAIIDGLWLTLVGPKLYRPIIGEILADKVSLAPAIVFYLLYVAGIVVLAVGPTFRDGTWVKAAILGAVVGLVAYGTYDLTNQATLKVWSLRLTLADMVYGTVATSLAAIGGFRAAAWAGQTFG